VTPGGFAEVLDGVQSFDRHTTCQRHRHDGAYAAVVLAGGYIEAGESGRYRVGAGDVLIHGAFDAHRDLFGASSSIVLNLRLPATLQLPFILGRVRDLDRIARLAERNDAGVVQALLDEVEPAGASAMTDWPDILAHDLAVRTNLPIAAWASAHGLAGESVSRGFRRVYGVAPARFRAELRARKAWRMLVTSGIPLSTVALQSGFSDQAHMTRGVRWVTGRPPGEWRRSNPFKIVRRA
jgi:AraC-like DNA-binding protein